MLPLKKVVRTHFSFQDRKKENTPAAKYDYMTYHY